MAPRPSFAERREGYSTLSGAPLPSPVLTLSFRHSSPNRPWTAPRKHVEFRAGVVDPRAPSTMSNDVAPLNAGELGGGHGVV